jgi:hypothetical protein
VAPWLPYRTPHRAVVDPRSIPDIPVELVTAAVDDLLASGVVGATRPRRD